jgi:hypothetical protein
MSLNSTLIVCISTAKPSFGHHDRTNWSMYNFQDFDRTKIKIWSASREKKIQKNFKHKYAVKMIYKCVLLSWENTAVQVKFKVSKKKIVRKVLAVHVPYMNWLLFGTVPYITSPLLDSKHASNSPTKQQSRKHQSINRCKFKYISSGRTSR